MNSIFNRPFLCERSHSAGPRELSIPILLDEKSTFVPGGSVGERSGGARNRLDGAARSEFERAAPSALRWQAGFGSCGNHVLHKCYSRDLGQLACWRQGGEGV